MSTTAIVIISIIVLLIGGFFGLTYFKKKNQAKMFQEVYQHSKQVPKSKKKNFLLFMFREAMAKKKSKASSAMLNNPKYLEIQMMQMGQILKDPSKVKDRRMQSALSLLKDYQKWEEAQRVTPKAKKDDTKNASDSKDTKSKKSKKSK